VVLEKINSLISYKNKGLNGQMMVNLMKSYQTIL